MAFTTTDGDISGASAMRVEQGRLLHGLREIATALRCSEKSVLRYVEHYGLPAGKIGGRWCADEARLREWRGQLAALPTGTTERPASVA